MKIPTDLLATTAAVFLLLLSSLAQAEIPAPSANPSSPVKIAAVQISGYDKGDLPKEGTDVVATLLPYIERAQLDGAELVVFPEYVLGHIPVPGPETKRL
ncbi:MAG: hypothetical protein AAF514_02160, partial [Verrucomicrobiota bacterium]